MFLTVQKAPTQIQAECALTALLTAIPALDTPTNALSARAASTKAGVFVWQAFQQDNTT